MTTLNKWLIGCGSGCAVLVLVGLGLMLAAGMWVKGTVSEFDEVTELTADLERAHGAAAEFVPWPDGEIPAERIEAFLAVREATQETRLELAETFSAITITEEQARELEHKGFWGAMGEVMGITRSAVGLVGQLSGLFRSRDQALLEQGMGLGEYCYLYAVVYYGWLEHDPAEGLTGTVNAEGEVQVQGISQIGPDDRVLDDLRAMIDNQREALDDDADPQWADELDEEIRRLEGNHRRFPWQGTLPVRMAEGLVGYRDRLEATYHAATNPMELAQLEKTGKYSFSTR